jgi:hypothetical protein
MLNKNDIAYLLYRAKTWGLKYREPITVGTYRWYLFMYTNLYECSPGHKIDDKDRRILTSIFIKLKPEHKLTWIRHKLYEASEDIENIKKEEMGETIIDQITNIREFKVALFVMHCIEIKDYILDDYVLDTFKYLEKYRR